jgi:hypothetical protein
MTPISFPALQALYEKATQGPFATNIVFSPPSPHSRTRSSAGHASDESRNDTQPDVGGMADGLADRLDTPGWWSVERGIPRVAGKQPHRADRLRGLGNGQVALCKAAAWRLLGGP